MKILKVFRSLPHEPHVGNILLYQLRSEEIPTSEGQLFRGVIKTILVDMQSREQLRYYLVAPDDHPEYEELVYPQQVRGYLIEETV